MTVLDSVIPREQFEHNAQEIINRIVSLALTEKGGFGAYFVHGYELHEALDAHVAGHFNVDRSIDTSHVVLGDMVLKRTVSYASTEREKHQDDSGVVTGYSYWVDYPDVI